MGGSVRIPAALCGVLGMKPSLGRIPMDILSTGFDNISHFGAFARSIGDLHAFLRVTEGASLMDIQSTSIHQPICANINSDLRGTRIAVSEDLGFYSVDKCIIRNLQNSVNALIDAGAIIEKVSLNWKPSDVTLWAKLWAVLLSVETADVVDVFHDRLDPELMKFMSSVRELTAVDYKMLDRRRTELWQDLASLFSVYDALLCPTMCITAPAIGMSDADFTMIDETGRLHAMDMTCLFNLVGQCPVVAVPSGLDLGGLPTSVQIVGRPYQDSAVLNIGAALEARNPWPLIPSMSM
jgi:Asp-tRNA(Asn)/Glu-tRNA(Gln) amidotransferase A subunit family amidase